MTPVTLGAGGTGGNANAGILQNVDAVLGGNTGDRQRQNVGCFVGAIEGHAGQRGKLFHKAVQQALFLGHILAEGCTACGAGGGKGENGGSAFRAAAQIALLAAAYKKGREGFQPGCDVQSADALGAVNLMSGDGDQIRS